MPHYRIYLLNTERHIISVQEAECPDDDAALAQATGLMDGHAGVEIWQEARLVGHLPWQLPDRHSDVPSA